jgi:hypothetical protein
MPWISALGLIFTLQGCDGPDNRPQEHGQALVAPAVPAAGEAKDPQSLAAVAAGTTDNQAQAERSALGSADSFFLEPATAELLDALLWAAAGSDPEAREALAGISARLMEQGAAALPDVLDLIQELIDSPLSAYPDQPEFDQLAALIDLLLSFDLPEVEHLALEVLSDELPAHAVCRLAAFLESARPGRYTQEIRFAAERALIRSDDATPLPGPLFQYLGLTGDASTTVLLAQMPLHRDAYASVALALIPDGSGLAYIERDARLLEDGRDTVQGRLAIELLAQQAHRFPEAADVLLDLAGRGLIPEDVWPHLFELVAGRWELTLSEPANGRMGTHTIYRPQGNQVIYRVARQEELIGISEYDRRLELLDSLRRLAPSIAGFHE